MLRRNKNNEYELMSELKSLTNSIVNFQASTPEEATSIVFSTRFEKVRLRYMQESSFVGSSSKEYKTESIMLSVSPVSTEQYAYYLNQALKQNVIRIQGDAVLDVNGAKMITISNSGVKLSNGIFINNLIEPVKSLTPFGAELFTEWLSKQLNLSLSIPIFKALVQKRGYSSTYEKVTQEYDLNEFLAAAVYTPTLFTEAGNLIKLRNEYYINKGKGWSKILYEASEPESVLRVAKIEKFKSIK